MRNARKWAGIVAGVLAFSLIAAACSNDDDAQRQLRQHGRVRRGTCPARSTSRARPRSSRSHPRRRELRRQNTGVNVAVDGPGTTDGFVLVLQGRDRHQRRVAPDRGRREDGLLRRRRRLRGARDRSRRLTVVANPPNRGRLPQLRRPLRAVRPGVRGLHELDRRQRARQEGRRQRWTSRTCRSTIVAPGTESGTYGSFIDLGDHRHRGRAGQARGPRHAPPRLPVSPDDNVIIQTRKARRAPSGSSASRTREGAGRPIKEFRIDNGGGCIGAGRGHLNDGSYPLSRTLYIYVNTESGDQPGAEGVRGLLPVRRRHREGRQRRIHRASDRSARRLAVHVGVGFRLGILVERRAWTGRPGRPIPATPRASKG